MSAWTVAVVEDHEPMRTMVAGLVDSDRRFRVAGTAGTVADAVRLLDDGVDVALVDLDLGGEDGTVLLDRARRAGAVPVVMTGHPADSPEAERARAAGACAVVSKLDDPAGLVDRLVGALQVPAG